MEEPSLGKREFARDVSNIRASDLPTPTKCGESHRQVVPSPAGCWTSADQFKFVEEDDDEVLFRVRDSGVLRSLALPVPASQSAISVDETLEEKQARVRALRMSFLVEKPPTLPSLSEVVEKSGHSVKSDIRQPEFTKPKIEIDPSLTSNAPEGNAQVGGLLTPLKGTALEGLFTPLARAFPSFFSSQKKERRSLNHISESVVPINELLQPIDGKPTTCNVGDEWSDGRSPTPAAASGEDSYTASAAITAASSSCGAAGDSEAEEADVFVDAPDAAPADDSLVFETPGRGQEHPYTYESGTAESAEDDPEPCRGAVDAARGAENNAAVADSGSHDSESEKACVCEADEMTIKGAQDHPESSGGDEKALGEGESVARGGAGGDGGAGDEAPQQRSESETAAATEAEQCADSQIAPISGLDAGPQLVEPVLSEEAGDATAATTDPAPESPATAARVTESTIDSVTEASAAAGESADDTAAGSQAPPAGSAGEAVAGVPALPGTAPAADALTPSAEPAENAITVPLAPSAAEQADGDSGAEVAPGPVQPEGGAGAAYSEIAAVPMDCGSEDAPAAAAFQPEETARAEECAAAGVGSGQGEGDAAAAEPESGAATAEPESGAATASPAEVAAETAAVPSEAMAEIAAPAATQNAAETTEEAAARGEEAPALDVLPPAALVAVAVSLPPAAAAGGGEGAVATATGKETAAAAAAEEEEDGEEIILLQPKGPSHADRTSLTPPPPSQEAQDAAAAAAATVVDAPASPPAKAAGRSTAPAAGAPAAAVAAVCIRRAGCTCADCNMTLGLLASAPLPPPAAEAPASARKRKAKPAAAAGAPKAPPPAAEEALAAAGRAEEGSDQTAAVTTGHKPADGEVAAAAVAEVKTPTLRRQSSPPPAEQPPQPSAAANSDAGPGPIQSAGSGAAASAGSDSSTDAASEPAAAAAPASSEPCYGKIQNSPPLKPAAGPRPVAAAAAQDAAGGPIKCIRRAGCLCPDCNMTLDALVAEPPAAPPPAGGHKGAPKSRPGPKSGHDGAATGKAAGGGPAAPPAAPKPAADLEEAKPPPPAARPKKGPGDTPTPRAEPAQDSRPAVPASGVVASPPAAAAVRAQPASPPARSAAPAAAKMSGGATPLKCLRRAGCTCADCSAMMDMFPSLSAAAGGAATITAASPTAAAAVPAAAIAKEKTPAADSDAAAASQQTAAKTDGDADKLAVAAAPRQQARGETRAGEERPWHRKPAAAKTAAAAAGAPAAADSEEQIVFIAATAAGPTSPVAPPVTDANSAAADTKTPPPADTSPPSPAAPAAALADAPACTPSGDGSKATAAAAAAAGDHLPVQAADADADAEAKKSVSPAAAAAAAATAAKLGPCSGTPAAAVRVRAAALASPAASVGASPGAAAANALALTELLDIDDCPLESPAAAPAPAPAVAAGERQERVRWEIGAEWDAPQPPGGKASSAAPALAPAPAREDGGKAVGGRQMYTLEDVERIASYQKEALKVALERERDDLQRRLAVREAELDAARGENLKLQAAVGEASAAVDDLARALESERAGSRRLAKDGAEVKAYADELEAAFNEMHGRYTKLKEYYTVADGKNVELSAAAAHANELLRRCQESVAEKDAVVKGLEARLAAETDGGRRAVGDLQARLDAAERQGRAVESELKQSAIRVQVGQQELTEIRQKVDEFKGLYVSAQQQLKAKSAALLDVESRLAKAEAEAAEKKKKADESSKNPDDPGLLKARLHKAELERQAVQGRLEAETLARATLHAENLHLNKICDELMQMMEDSKSKR